ncbi:MAG: FMN-binding negative transcriptional regulator [Hellea sp.]
MRQLIRHIATDFNPMHPTPAFHYDDRGEALAFISAYPFATLAVNGKQGPVTALVPLVIDNDGLTLLGHVARMNRFWEAARQGGGQAVAIFCGADAYVSPSFYPSKQEHGKAVPTWNYVAVEIRGEITIETQAEAMMPYITALTDKMESHREGPWQVSDAPDDYIAKLSRGIVGFRLSIEDVTHVKKVSQNKSEADKQGVVQSLANSQNMSERAMAMEMTKTH